MRYALFAIGTLAICSTSAQAQLIVNGSFESASVNPFATLSTGSTAISGWTVGGSIDYVGADWVASNGSRSLDLNGLSPGSISQTFSTIPGQRYEVLFDMAANTGLFPPDPPVTMTLRTSAAGVSEVFSFGTLGHSYGNMGWQTKHFGFTATDAATTLSFTSLSAATGSAGPALDNVIAALVPEPSTLGLLFSASAGWCLWQRKNCRLFANGLSGHQD